VARRRSPVAVDVDATAVPAELLDYDHPVWSDRRGFEALLDRIDPERRHRPRSYLSDNPALRFDYAAHTYAAANGLFDPRWPNSYAAGLASVGVRLAGCRRRLRNPSST